MPRPIATQMPATIQKRTTMLTSLHPASSKWCCSGDMRNTRLPVVLNEMIWITTDIVMMTNSPPMMISSSSVRVDIPVPVLPERDQRVRAEHHHRGAGGQAVEAVGEVHPVGRGQHDEHEQD